MKIFIIMALALVLFISCDEMNELHQKYLDEGEIVYIGLPDSVTVRNGLGRIQLQWQLNADPKISSCAIYWNFRQDSTIIPLDPSNKTPTVILDLVEGKYNFELINRDVAGNTSLTSEISGRSYGNEYRIGLYNRPLSMIPAKDSLILNWGDAENCTGINMQYQNKEGVPKTLYVDASVSDTVLYDCPFGGKFSYKSFYLPEEDALDTIASEYSEYSFPNYFVLSKAEWTEYNKKSNYPSLDRSTWTIDYASTQESEKDGPAVAANILDNKTGTFWHSQWFGTGANPPLPHTIIVDMQENRTITSLELARRQNNGDLKDINFEVSTDKVGWESAGSLSFPNDKTAANNSKVVVFPDPVSGRYLKLKITGSNNSANASISEIYLTGVN